MKEILNQKLANASQTPYSKYGDNFMEGKPDMSPANSQPSNPENGGKTPLQESPAPAAMQNRARKAWNTLNKGRVLSFDEKGVTEELIRRGERPAITGAQEPPDEGPPPPPTGETPREEPVGNVRDQADRILNDLATEQVAFRNVASGITDESLIRQLNAVRGVFSTNPQDMTGELRRAIERISLLERVAEEREDPAVKQERDRIFTTQRDSVIGRLRSLAENTRRAIGVLTSQEIREGVFGERKLSEEEKERIRNARETSDIDDLFNRVFDKVDRRPNADFNTAFGTVGAYEYDEFMRVLNDAINQQNRVGNSERVNELEAIVSRLSNERAAREIIHNAYFAVITGQNTEAMANYASSFMTGYADLAFDKAGVVQSMHFYEQALLMVREKHGGYLPAKDVVGNLKTNQPGEVNVITERMFREANERGEMPGGRRLQKWEIDRALSFARGMSVIMGRSIEIAATSISPGTESGSSAFIDLFAQRIIQELYPFRHVLKFNVGSKFSKVLAYLLDNKRSPWTPKELLEFQKMGLADQIKVLDDLMPEGQERFYSVLNPFEIGGWLSRTGWRIGGDPRNPGVSAIKDMMQDENERGWIGTGVIIERERGGLESKDPQKKAETVEKIKFALERTAKVTPLRFLLNMRDFKERVLTDLYNGDYFTADEKRAIQDKIDEGIRKRENFRDVHGIVKAETLPEDTKRTIKFQEIMQSAKLSRGMEQLALLQERALLTKDEGLVARESELGRILQEKFLHDTAGEIPGGKGRTEPFIERFLRRLEHKGWKVPFVFGTEDIPFEKYSFEETGPRSAARRWADMAAGAKAGNAFSEFLKGFEIYTQPEQIVEKMSEIHAHIKDYNEEYAEQFTTKLAEGVIKFYAKSWTHRLPLGMGTARSFMRADSSWAQIAYGRGKMAWDELQINEFTRLLRDKGLIKIEQQHELQKRAGGGKKEVVWGYTRTVLPLIMIALAYYIMSEAAKEKS